MAKSVWLIYNGIYGTNADSIFCQKTRYPMDYVIFVVSGRQVSVPFVHGAQAIPGGGPDRHYHRQGGTKRR